MNAPPTIPEPVRFLECQIHPVTTREFIDIAIDRSRRSAGRPLRVTYLNAHCSNLAARDKEYCASVNRCDLVYADGQAVVWAARRLGAPVPERVSAGDFAEPFCLACAKEGVRLFLLGGAEGLAEATERVWRERAPGLEVVGTHTGFFDREEEEAIAEKVRAARPDVLLVGMSAPVQEAWMERWADPIGVPVVWCVGALFEYFGQRRPRAPRWMRRAGLEWLFRLALEPRRLWRRYLLGNCVFVGRVASALAAGRKA